MAKRKTGNITGYRYMGGAHIHGVPAKDLSIDQYKKYADVIEEQKELTKMVLYEPIIDSAANEEATTL